MEAAVDAAMGLSVLQAQAVFSKSTVTRGGAIDPKMIGEAKKQIIQAGAGIEYYDADPRGLAAVGGLDLGKEWLADQRHAFSEDAAAFGLKKPKGMLLVGQPGCGKSLMAKAVAAAWVWPLLRLDLGAVLGGIVGQSEQQLAKVFAIIEAIGYCVVWLDEMEKMTGGEGLDGGVGKRQQGALLTWMEDRKSPAFLIATANDVHKLPAELLRKGRFDEIFFVDLPTSSERRAILDVSFKSVGRTTVGINVDEVIRVTAGFTGSEVASLVPSALFIAFKEGKRALKTEDLLLTAKNVVPLSNTAKESVKARREWARERARPASLPEVEEQGSRAAGLDVEEVEDGIDYTGNVPGSN